LFFFAITLYLVFLFTDLCTSLSKAPFTAVIQPHGGPDAYLPHWRFGWVTAASLLAVIS